ncbi:MAG: RtcB family protein [Bradymonadia bacterium]
MSVWAPWWPHRHHLYPAAVGGDIGCGVAALPFDVDVDAITPRTGAAILSALQHLVPIMRHTEPLPWPLDLAEAPPSGCVSIRQARQQLGTLGRGNHFLELQADDTGTLWVTVHSGSRGPGKAIRDFHVGTRRPFDPIDARAPEGEAYLADLLWARGYAQANRHAMLYAAAAALERVLGATPSVEGLIECDHNHVQCEDHHGPCWVHRKGAIPAHEGMLGVVPGSMGSATFHVEGRGCSDALCSSAHGAGRALTRTQARQQIRAPDLVHQMRGVLFDPRKAHHLVEEAPGAYRDIERVMRAQRPLVRILRRLRPVLSHKGG